MAKKILKIGLYLLLLMLVVPLSYNALTYINFDFQYSFLRLKQQAIATGWYLPAYYSHVLLGGLILMIGLFQLNSKARQKWRTAHRWGGYFYVAGILFFACPGGMVMSFFIGRGPVVLASFLTQGSLWFYFTYWAYRKIREGKISEHRKWMLRSYALTFAAVTLRVYIFVFSAFFDLSQPLGYAILSWLSWTPNLLVMNEYLRRNPVA